MFTLNYNKPLDNPDVFEIGTPGRQGSIKVHGNYNQPGKFKELIRNAIEVQQYANKMIKETFNPPE